MARSLETRRETKLAVLAEAEAALQKARDTAPAAQVAARPGFRLILARSSDGYVGFGYGYLLPDDSTWWSGVVEPLDAAFTHETGGRTFAVIDYGVQPGSRGTGIGRAVHDALLGGSGGRATPTVRPTAIETQTIYLRWGGGG